MKKIAIYQKSHGGYYLRIDGVFFTHKNEPISLEELDRRGKHIALGFTDITVEEGKSVEELVQAWLKANSEARKASLEQSRKEWAAILEERERKIASGEIILSVFEKIKRHAKTQSQGNSSMPDELFKELIKEHPEIKSVSFNYYDCEGSKGYGLKCHPYIKIEGEKYTGIGYAPRGYLNKYYRI